MAKTIKLPSLPKVGSDIYVDSSLYLSHGKDDFAGGLAQVYKITKEKHGLRKVHGIQIVERPGHTYYWENGLAEKQTKLKKEYGKRRSRPDPDYHPSLQ